MLLATIGEVSLGSGVAGKLVGASYSKTYRYFWTGLVGAFLDKKMFSSCIIVIAVISLFSPTIISTLMRQQSSILNTHYYIQYIANLLSFHLSLFFLASLVLVLFLKKDQ